MTEVSSPALFQLATEFLPDTLEKSKIQKVRILLGSAVSEMSDEQLETFTAQCEYLLNCWLDEYERKIFAGKTLKELLSDG